MPNDWRHWNTWKNSDLLQRTPHGRVKKDFFRSKVALSFAWICLLLGKERLSPCETQRHVSCHHDTDHHRPSKDNKLLVTITQLKFSIHNGIISLFCYSSTTFSPWKITSYIFPLVTTLILCLLSMLELPCLPYLSPSRTSAYLVGNTLLLLFTILHAYYVILPKFYHAF